MHLAGFITRIYHDARSPERQIHIGENASDTYNLYNNIGPAMFDIQ